MATERNRRHCSESAEGAPLFRRGLAGRGGLQRLAAWVAVFLLGVPASQALNPAKRLTQFLVNQWQVKDGLAQNGLPQNSVSCLVQSVDGFLWIGTGDGVARFDGANFTAFEDRAAVANRNLSVRALCAARDGSIWFGTKGGLNRIAGNQVTSGAPSLRELSPMICVGAPR